MEITDTDGDLALIDRVASGDRTALAAAFDRFAPTLTRYAWALASDRSDVEELVQDTFLTFWQKSETLEVPTGTLLPWLLVVCRNHARNLIRKRTRHEASELPSELLGAPDADEAREQLRWVLAEIAALPPIDRRICELCLIEGRPYSEAAATLGLSVGAVTQRVARSRTRLKKAVTHDEH